MVALEPNMTEVFCVINGKFEWGNIDGSDWYYGSSIVLTYTLGQDPRSGWQIMW